MRSESALEVIDFNGRLLAAKGITRLGLAFTWVGEKLIRFSAWLIDFRIKEID
jgi:hypothetical protein